MTEIVKNATIRCGSKPTIFLITLYVQNRTFYLTFYLPIYMQVLENNDILGMMMAQNPGELWCCGVLNV